MVQRRQFLKFAPAVAAATVFPKIAAAVPIPANLNDYYAFLWLEMERVEQALSVGRLDPVALDAGRDCAERLLSATTMADRAQVFAAVYLCPETTAA